MIMLIKDIFTIPPTHKDEYWKYTNLNFLNLEVDSESNSVINTNLEPTAPFEKDYVLNSFISLNNEFENITYTTENSSNLSLVNYKGLNLKKINFITPANQKHQLSIHIESQNEINDLIVLFLKMNFLVLGQLDLTIISNMRYDYNFNDINVILMDDASVNFNYISNTSLNKKIFINSQQYKNSHFDFKFRTLVTEKDNIDLTLSSNIIEENCFLNHDIKCVLQKKSTFSCLGEINILPSADNAEAYHYNSSLALSEDIRVNSRPVLKISNGNVKCSHGSPSSYIKDDDRFYMNSRGISKKDADKIYVTSFLNCKNTIIESLIDSEV